MVSVESLKKDFETINSKLEVVQDAHSRLFYLGVAVELCKCIMNEYETSRQAIESSIRKCADKELNLNLLRLTND